MTRIVVQIRCSEEEKRVWVSAALAAGLSLSDYIRARLASDRGPGGPVASVFARRAA